MTVLATNQVLAIPPHRYWKQATIVLNTKSSTAHQKSCLAMACCYFQNECYKKSLQSLKQPQKYHSLRVKQKACRTEEKALAPTMGLTRLMWKREDHRYIAHCNVRPRHLGEWSLTPLSHPDSHWSRTSCPRHQHGLSVSWVLLHVTREGKAFIHCQEQPRNFC